jgi:hypothetical protein
MEGVMDGRTRAIDRLGAVGKAILGAAMILGTVARAADAQFVWKPGFDWPGGNGLSSAVQAFTVFDDGTGPALYAGGYFSIGGALGTAKWDGSAWTPLSPGMDGGVLALTVFDDGTGPALYAGGSFTTAGDAPANHIAKWDGTMWTPLGSGMENPNDAVVYALAVFDDGTGPALYAGGKFTTAGGAPANGIAKWDGATWTPLGSGVDRFVFALTVFDDGTGRALYAGGQFYTAGGVVANSIARWNGTTWTTLGSGIDQPLIGAYSLAIFDDGTGPALYVAGQFNGAGGVTAHNIAKWNGSTWTALSSEIENGGIVFALTVFDEGTGPALYAGGFFTQAGGITTNDIAKWNGTTWAPLSSGMDASVLALSGFDDGTGLALYVGGQFATAGGIASRNIAKWGGQ